MTLYSNTDSPNRESIAIKAGIPLKFYLISRIRTSEPSWSKLVISWSLYIKLSIFLRRRIIRCHEFFTIRTRYELIYTPKRKNTLILSV